MSPVTISEELAQIPNWHQRHRTIVVTIVISLITVLLATGLLLVIRRFAGAFSSQLPRATMLIAAMLATASLACARIAWRRCFPEHIGSALRGSDLAVGWGSSLALILLAVGCCYPAYYNSDWFIWLPLLIADQFWRQSFFDAGRPEIGIDSAEEPLSDSLHESEITSSPSGEMQDIVQQIFRLRNDAGFEVVYGTLRAEFQQGQRTAVAHVGFCPPLAYRPDIEAEALPGSHARINVVQALPHGVRLDVKLPQPALEACHLWIDMAATPPPEMAEQLTA